MPRILIYTTATCPYCIRAKRLLDGKKVKYREIRIDTNPQQMLAMMQRSNRRTVPQIFIGEYHVGGYDDLAELDADGELDQLLIDAK